HAPWGRRRCCLPCGKREAMPSSSPTALPAATRSPTVPAARRSTWPGSCSGRCRLLADPEDKGRVRSGRKRTPLERALIWGAGTPFDLPAVNREGVAEGADFLADLRFDSGIPFRILGQGVQDTQDEVADLLELGLAEAASRSGRGAQTDAGGDEGLLRIVRDGVLVAGQARALQGDFGCLAGHALGAQVDQDEMAVGAAGDDPQAALLQHLGECLRVDDDLPGVVLELGLEGLAEGHGLGSDDVHQRPALVAGEDGAVDLL